MSDTEDEREFRDLVFDAKAKQFRRRQEQQASRIVRRLLARRGYDQHEQQDQIETAWRAVVPSQLVAQTKCGRVQRGTLEVIVTHSLALSELMFQKRQLLKQLNQRPEAKAIKDLRFKLGAID